MCPSLTDGQTVIHDIESPIKSSGHIQILYGNLAPEGSVAKITGKEGLQFRGPARVFDSEEEMIAVVYEDPQKLKVGLTNSAPRCLESGGLTERRMKMVFIGLVLYRLHV